MHRCRVQLVHDHNHSVDHEEIVGIRHEACPRQHDREQRPTAAGRLWSCDSCRGLSCNQLSTIRVCCTDGLERAAAIASVLRAAYHTHVRLPTAAHAPNETPTARDSPEQQPNCPYKRTCEYPLKASASAIFLSRETTPHGSCPRAGFWSMSAATAHPLARHWSLWVLRAHKGGDSYRDALVRAADVGSVPDFWRAWDAFPQPRCVCLCVAVHVCVAGCLGVACV